MAYSGQKIVDTLTQNLSGVNFPGSQTSAPQPQIPTQPLVTAPPVTPSQPNLTNPTVQPTSPAPVARVATQPVAQTPAQPVVAQPVAPTKMTPQEQISSGYKYDIYTGQLLQPQTTQTTQPQTTAPTKTQAELDLEASAETRRKLDEDYTAEANKARELMTNISMGYIPLSPEQQAQVESLKQSYQKLIQTQELVNKTDKGVANVRGYQKGSAEYDPMFQIKTIGSIVTGGINKISALNTEMAGAVAKLTYGFREGNIKAVKDAFSLYESSYNKRAEAVDKLVEETQTRIELAEKQREAQEKEFYDRFEKPLNEIMTKAAEGGASPSVLAQIQNAGSIGEALSYAGSSLESGSGIVGEYLYYKKQAEAAGQSPVDFETYQNRDANRKISLARAAASTNAGGLTSQENSTFLTVTNKYQADSVINAAIKAGQVRTLADQIIADPNSATNQLASLYLFVKNLDPDSAVREGELALANQTQSYLGKFGNSFARISEGRVLSPKAASELAKATKDLVATWESTAEKKTKLYKAQANNSSPNVGNAFNQYLKDSQLLGSVSDEIMKDDAETEEIVTNSLNSIKATNPKLFNTVSTMYTSINPNTGQAYSAREILEAFPELNN